jgi:hypothetical protein
VIEFLVCQKGKVRIILGADIFFIAAVCHT